MDEMPSSEFRKVYAKLTDRTIVTVNGHVMGEWIPASYDPLAGLDRKQIKALANSRWPDEESRQRIIRGR